MNFYTNVERFANTILWRGYENGISFMRREQYRPKLFLPSKDGKYTSLIGKRPLAPRVCDSMGEAKEFIERHKDVHGFDIYGNTNYVTQFIQEKYPGQIKFDPSLINIAAFDIEVDISNGYANVDEADKEITSISYKSSRTDTYHLLGRKGYDKTKTITGIDPDDILFMEFDTEEAMLRRFIQIWSNDYPDIVTGWNVEYFDIMYIVTRISRVLSEDHAKKLSPWNYIQKRTREQFGKPASTYTISGVAVIDYLDAFRKFGYKYGPQESYKLDHIAHVVLGEKKLDYSEYGNLTALYEKNPQLYLDYNLKDTHLIVRMEEETGLLSLVMTVAYGGGVNFNDAFGTVGIWEATIYRKLMEKKIVPALKRGPGQRAGELVGGYVKDPQVGMHPWVVSFDLNSLYPHLMLQYNMSPETYLEDTRKFVTPDMVLKETFMNTDPHISVCANGACFTNEKLGVIPEIIEEYYANRKTIKKEMLRVEQAIELIKEEMNRRKKAA